MGCRVMVVGSIALVAIMSMYAAPSTSSYDEAW
jgi:hypothetical protein